MFLPLLQTQQDQYNEASRGSRKVKAEGGSGSDDYRIAGRENRNRAVEKSTLLIVKAADDRWRVKPRIMKKNVGDGQVVSLSR
jgi:hypothetical protein